MQDNRNVVNTKPKKTKIRVIIVLVFLVLFALATFISLRGSYLEILEIGENYLSIFWKNVTYKYVTMTINFIFLFVLIYLLNRSIRKGLKVFFEDEKRIMPKLPNKSIALILGSIISFLTASYLSNYIMLCFNNAWFGAEDPIFGMDIGYFIFQKPFIELMLWYLLILIIGLTIYTVIYYIVCFNVYFDGVSRETLKKSKFIKQLTTNIFIVVVVFALLTLIGTQDIVFSRFLKLREGTANYELYGAGITDVTIKLWGYRLLAIVMVLSVFMAIRFFKKEQTKKMILSLLVVPTYLVGLLLIMLVFQVSFVNSNELDKQKKYILSNIQYTKNAYNINVEETALTNSGTVTLQEVQDYADIINNIAIVSKDATLKELNNSQTSKGYYTYNTTQIGKYLIDGQETLVYVSPREIISNEGSRTYNNKTYEYTHGYGAIFSSAVSTTQTGNVSYIQKGFEETENVLAITEPRIYFGLKTNNTVVTNSKNKREFDYPILNSKNADNAENIYDGKAGLQLNFIDRCILAIKERDLNLGLSGNITKDSKILTNRNIIQRAKILMPYLVYDEEPYLVITKEGKLVWILDAYTVTNNYPYSQRTMIEQNGMRQEINYIRNSVKVLIDAYDGTIQFYITDRNDPLIMAYHNIYPDLFVDKEEEIPEDIRKHLVYPEFLYKIQANMLTRYHNVQPDVLYRNDDIWDIATHKVGKTSTTTGNKMAPYYTMVKNGQGENTIGLMQAYTPYKKQNLISYLVGNYEGAEARLNIYKFSSDSNIIGPMQLDTQIEQDERISKELETLNVSGTKMIRDMLMVPIYNTVLYVEPIYQVFLNESNSPIQVPVLKKIVVASGNKVAIGDTLKEALNNLLSQYAVDIEVENTEDIEGLLDAIIKANTNLKASGSNNDWEMIGKDMSKLQELIDKLQDLLEEKERENKKEPKEENTSVNEQNVENIPIGI